MRFILYEQQAKRNRFEEANIFYCTAGLHAGSVFFMRKTACPGYIDHRGLSSPGERGISVASFHLYHADCIGNEKNCLQTGKNCLQTGGTVLLSWRIALPVRPDCFPPIGASIPRTWKQFRPPFCLDGDRLLNKLRNNLTRSGNNSPFAVFCFAAAGIIQETSPVRP